MKVKLDKFRKLKDCYFVRVLVNPDELDETKHIYEEFRWGLDTPLNQVKTETLLLLKEKYVQSEEILVEEGKEIEI